MSCREYNSKHSIGIPCLRQGILCISIVKWCLVLYKVALKPNSKLYLLWFFWGLFIFEGLLVQALLAPLTLIGKIKMQNLIFLMLVGMSESTKTFIRTECRSERDK